MGIGQRPEHPRFAFGAGRPILQPRHGEAATRVEIEHRGWERLGTGGADWRDRNRGGWATLLPHYVAAAGTRRAAD